MCRYLASSFPPGHDLYSYFHSTCLHEAKSPGGGVRDVDDNSLLAIGSGGSTVIDTDFDGAFVLEVRDLYDRSHGI